MVFAGGDFIPLVAWYSLAGCSLTACNRRLSNWVTRKAPPAFRGSDHRFVHELEHGPLSEDVGDDLQPEAFLHEQGFQQVGRADHLAVGDWKARVGSPPSIALSAVGFRCQRRRP